MLGVLEVYDSYSGKKDRLFSKDPLFPCDWNNNTGRIVCITFKIRVFQRVTYSNKMIDVDRFIGRFRNI